MSTEVDSNNMSHSNKLTNDYPFASLINYLDSNGASEWNLLHVAGISAIVLLLIKVIVNKKGGIDWYALIHSIASASGAFICFYLNEYVAMDLTGTSEPLRTLQCAGPLTSLHRVVPAITMGYAVIDCIDGLIMYGTPDFIIHGTATFAAMYYFVEAQGSPHVVAPMLILECSTIFLNILGIAPLLPSALSILVVLSFAIAFFVFRIVLFPYVHYKFMITAYEQMTNPLYMSCYPPSFIYVCGGFGLIFHCLNVFWFYKILLKLKRKIVGKEKFTDKNSCEAYNQEVKAALQRQQQEAAAAAALAATGSTNGSTNGYASNGTTNGYSTNGTTADIIATNGIAVENKKQL